MANKTKITTNKGGSVQIKKPNIKSQAPADKNKPKGGKK